MIEFNEREQEPGEEGGGLSVAVVGIGGAGANVLDRIALEGMTEAELVCMNTDIRALTNSVAATKVQLGKNLTQGLDAGGDPDLGEDAAKSSEEDIRNAVRGKDIVFVCGGLGGGTGSGAAPFISGIARSEGAFVVAFTTMPFSFEGRRRLSQAQASLNQLRKTANALITFDNDRMGSLVLPKQGIQEAFAEADKIISQSVRAVIQLVTKPGLISIGMDDLITALDNDDSRCLFGYGQATGENRAQEALSTALKSPLLDKGEMLEEAQNVLVHVCGGDSMTLFEVELLMKSLEKEVSEKAQILFGVGSDPKLGDKLSVTVISSMGKPLPPTADDSTPKAAHSDVGDEEKDSAAAEALKPEASQSSRSEVKPDQSASSKTAAPVAAATTLGASILTAPVGEVTSRTPRARMSAIRRAVQPAEYSAAVPAEEENKKSTASDGDSSGVRAETVKSDLKSSGSGKGVISIFEDDDDDDSTSIFDDADDDLDDDLDLMGDLGLDDEELDRLVAESTAAGLDDEESEESGKPLALLEDAALHTEDELESVVEEKIDDAEDLATRPTSGVEEPVGSDEGRQIAEEGEPQDPFEETAEFEDTFDDEDDLDEATVVAGAADEDLILDEADASSEDDEGFLVDGAVGDDFESFDDADDLEEEFDEVEVAEESEELKAAVEEVADEILGDHDLADDGEPLFDDHEEPESAPQSPPSESIAASVAPAQANKADELLKRVGLRRAPGGAQSARAPIASELPKGDPQDGGKTTRFAWSKPGTVPAAGKTAQDSPTGKSESKAKLPPPKARVAQGQGSVPAADLPAADSPFTPKGFVKKKQKPEDQARGGLPVQPTQLKLKTPDAPVEQTEPPVQEIAESESTGAVAAEQQNFDSTLEPKHQKGRFEKGEPTVEDGEDLDLPTFLRRKKG